MVGIPQLLVKFGELLQVRTNKTRLRAADVSELLAKEEVFDCLEDVRKNAWNIRRMIIVYETLDGGQYLADTVADDIESYGLLQAGITLVNNGRGKNGTPAS